MATKTLGFRLEVRGNDKTLSELDKVYKSLAAIRGQIKEVNSKQVKLNTAVDTKGLNDLLKLLDKAKNAKISPEATKEVTKLKSELVALKKELKLAQDTLDKLKVPELSATQVKEVNTHLIKTEFLAKQIIEGAERTRQAFNNIDDKSIRELDTSLAKLEIKLKGLRDAKIRVKADKTLSDNEKATVLQPLIEEEKKLVEQQKLLNREIAVTTKEFANQKQNIPKDSLIGLRTELSKLTLEYDKLTTAELEASKGTEIKNKINLVTNEINSREQAVQNFRRNVGNYQSAITGLLPELNKLSQAGIIAQKDMLAIFRSDLVAKEQALEKEVKDLGLAFKDLGNDISKAAQRAEIIGKLDDKVRELTSVRGNIDQLSNDFGRLSGKLLSVSDIVTGGLIGGGIIESIGALKSFASGSISEFTQAETAISKINQQLLVTGNASGQSAEGLVQMSKELEVLTGIDGDQILNDVTSALLKFTNIQGQVFGEAQKAALDLSTVMGGDLSGAANLLGKALDNPIKGISLLQKQGISLNDSTKKQIKAAVEANDAYTAQSLILKEVNQRFAGLSTAVNNSDLKGLRKLTVQFNNFKEAIGGVLVGAGNSFYQFIADIFNGVNVFSNSAIELDRGLKELTKTTNLEIAAIRGTLGALRDENIPREGKIKLIQDLVAKYPALLNQYDLEYASQKRLIEIENLLTANVIRQVAERTKQKTRESIISRQLQLAQEVAEAKAGKINIAATLQGRDQFIKKRLDQIEELKRQNIDLDKTFSNTEKELAKALGIELDPAIVSNLEQFRTQIKAVFGEITKVLNDPKSTEAAKAYALKTKLEFDKIDQAFSKATGTEEDRKKIIAKVINDISTLNKLNGRAITLPGADEETKTKTNDLEKQSDRISKLLERIRDLQAEAEAVNIQDTFDKQISEAKAKAQKEFDELNKQKEILINKKVLTDKDKQEIQLIGKVYQGVEQSLQSSIDAINKQRDDLQAQAISKLQTIKREVDKILLEISNTDINIEINQADFELGQAKRKIEIEFSDNLTELKKSLANGLISEQEYADQSQQIELEKLQAIEDLYDGFNDEYSLILDRKYKIDLDNINKTRLIAIQGIKDTIAEQNKLIQEDVASGKISPAKGFDLQLANLAKANAEIKKIDADYKESKIKLDNDLLKNKQDVSDLELEAHRSSEEKQTEITIQENEKRKNASKEFVKELLQQAKDQGVQLAQSVSDAIFDIQNGNSEDLFERSRSRIEKEFSTRLALAKGNVAEEQRLEFEKDQKLAKLEREQAARRRASAISQAVANSILASIKAFVDLGPIGGAVASLFIGAQLAVQIARIKREKFAKGGFAGGYTGGSRAPIDETGERPVDAELHEGEFVSTRKQVTKHRLIYDLLEKDRIKTNSGQASTIMADLENMVLKRRESIFASRPTRTKYEPIIPVIVPAASRQKIEIKLSDDQIKIFANEVARQVKEASLEGTTKGTIEGSIKAAKETFNFKLTKERATV